MIIPESEIEYSRLSLVDIGRVFQWGGRIFRAIAHEEVDKVRGLFDSGLVDRLVSEGHLIPSWITSYQLEGFGLIVEHERIRVPSYPREWSFSMVQDAASMVLSMNDIARTFGYQTKDCNGYNVLFRSGRPVFVDLGSFVRVDPSHGTLLAYEEFLLSYVYPLIMWKSGGQYIGSRALPRAFGQLLSPAAYLRFRWPIFRLMDDNKLTKGWKIICSLRSLGHNDLAKVAQRHPAWLVGLLRLARRSRVLESGARIPRLARRLRSLRHTLGASTWAGYHDTLHADGAPVSTERFDAVMARVATARPGAVLEIAGNQGVLARLLRGRSPDLHIVCTDPDGVALDKGYRSARDGREGIEWAVFNPFANEASVLEVSAESRFQADVVIALALTHHLTLTQNMRIEYVLDVLGAYCRDTLMVEFMPLGLHNGVSAPPIPNWYNETWFEKAFRDRFESVEKVQLEANRILFVGRKPQTGRRGD